MLLITANILDMNIKLGLAMGANCGFVRSIYDPGMSFIISTATDFRLEHKSLTIIVCGPLCDAF